MGRIIGNYEIIAELGRGGMGVVYKALDLTLQREVAIKVLSPHLAGNPQFVARFLREARAAAQLNHPNIARVYAVGEADGQRYIAMECVKGKTLAHWIGAVGEIEAPRALAIVREVAEALSVAHASGVIHRDIKPANIMIDEAGHVKVMDFGLAKFEDASSGVTRPGTLLGTPLYMAPEQIQGGEVDARADIYALGITLYEMLAGKPPFTADTPLALMYQIVEQPVPDLATCVPVPPASVRRVVSRMTAKKPEDRYPSVEALLDDLNAASSDKVAVVNRRPVDPWQETLSVLSNIQEFLLSVLSGITSHVQWQWLLYAAAALALVLLAVYGSRLTEVQSEKAASARTQVQQEVNLIPNPSFETIQDGMPVFWRPKGKSAQPNHEVSTVSHSGRYSISIAAAEPLDGLWRTSVEVVPQAEYRLVVWIKTEDVKTYGRANGAVLNLPGIKQRTEPLVGTHDWTRMEIVFRARDKEHVSIVCSLGGGGKATGKVWFDDVVLTREP